MSQIKAYFTTNERHRTTYGTNSERISSHSIVPADVCRLCLAKADDPVTCTHGHLFCRTHIIEFIAEHASLEIPGAAEAGEASHRAQVQGVAPDTSEVQGIYHPADMSLRFEAGHAPGAKRRRVEDTELAAGGINKNNIGSASTSKANANANGDLAADGSLERGKKAEGKEGKVKRSHHHHHHRHVRLNTPCPLSPSAAGDETADASLVHGVRVSRLQRVVFPGGGKCGPCGGDVLNALRPVTLGPCGHTICRGCADRFIGTGDGKAGPGTESSANKEAQGEPKSTTSTTGQGAAAAAAKEESSSSKKKGKKRASRDKGKEIGRCPTCDEAVTGVIDLTPGGSALAARHGASLISTVHTTMAL